MPMRSVSCARSPTSRTSRSTSLQSWRTLSKSSGSGRRLPDGKRFFPSDLNAHAERFVRSITDFENIAKYVTPELAYIVEVERFRTKIARREALFPVRSECPCGAFRALDHRLREHREVRHSRAGVHCRSRAVQDEDCPTGSAFSRPI